MECIVFFQTGWACLNCHAIFYLIQGVLYPVGESLNIDSMAIIHGSLELKQLGCFERLDKFGSLIRVCLGGRHLDRRDKAYRAQLQRGKQGQVVRVVRRFKHRCAWSTQVLQDTLANKHVVYSAAADVCITVSRPNCKREWRVRTVCGLELAISNELLVLSIESCPLRAGPIVRKQCCIQRRPLGR